MAQVVERLTRDRNVASSRPTGVTACAVSLNKARYPLLCTGLIKEDLK